MTTAKSALDDWESPLFAEFGPAELAGLNERYTDETSGGIPAQWGRFAPHLGSIPGQVGGATYGVCHNYNPAGEMDYLCAVEVAGGSPLPVGFATLLLSKRRYAVVRHRGHISKLRETWQYAWKRWAPEAGVKLGGGPEFERYSESFDPATGLGGVEIWIPLAEE